MRNKTIAGLGCGTLLGCFGLILVINLIVGGICADYCLWAYFGRDIAWWGDALIGIIAGEIVIPAALVGLVISLCGVPTPFCS